MRNIDKIIVHCSASSFGDAEDIDLWHRQRGWSQIGYHYVILNGHRDKHIPYNKGDDGFIEDGRPVEIKGAHCRRHNTGSIGVCLIGDRRFTGNQLYEALPKLLLRLMADHNIQDVLGHYHFNSHKTCPNINMAQVRKLLTLLKGE